MLQISVNNKFPITNQNVLHVYMNIITGEENERANGVDEDLSAGSDLESDDDLLLPDDSHKHGHDVNSQYPKFT